MTDADFVFRGGVVVDGLGGEPFEADVAVKDGKILSVGEKNVRGSEEIDARGLIVTPGFVDIHTHYDGQVTWENRTAPSSNHGVTTVVMGNCGVGFAPCKLEDRDRLIRLMEGVEDVPEVVMVAGLPWNWETFPDYLDALDRLHRDIDIVAQLPHSCLRVYVMGERAVNGEPATEVDLARMTVLSKEAMTAGAIGFATSRTIFHQDRDGRPIPSRNAEMKELDAIAQGMKQAGQGVLQGVLDYDNFENDFEMFRSIIERSGRPFSFSLVQVTNEPDAWRKALRLAGKANAEGLEVRAQVIGRSTGLLTGLDLSYNPFSLYPSFQAIAHLPLADKVAMMRQPEFKARLLGETPLAPYYPALKWLDRFEWTFALGDPPNYEPRAENSIAAIAQRRGVTPQEVAYDLLLENDGKGILFIPLANYANGNLDAVYAMLKDRNTILALGDGGAHYGVICDAGAPTQTLAYWARDRKGDRFSLQEIVRGLTSVPANAVRLRDRGILAPGYKADINVIDFDRLTLRTPEVLYDLPGGGRRLTQKAVGYVATMVNGTITGRDDAPTAALPGRLVRGEQPVPARSRSL
jgi:N-acyl-D-aspartate/D-glutamate deacylase